MKFSLSNEAPQDIATACLVIGVVEDAPLIGAAKQIDDSSGALISRMIESGDIDASRGYTTMLHAVDGVAAERVLVVGFGTREKLDLSRYEKTCMDAGKFLRDHPVLTAHFCVGEIELDGVDDDWCLRQAALAVHRSNYLYTATKKSHEHVHSPLEGASFSGGTQMQKALDQAQALATGFLRARELGNLPPNICTPSYLAGQARDIAQQYENVEVEILESAEMSELGMKALLAVGQGSQNTPRLIILKYQGAPEDQKPVVFVGRESPSTPAEFPLSHPKIWIR